MHLIYSIFFQDLYLETVHSIRHPSDAKGKSKPSIDPVTGQLNLSTVAVGGTPDPAIKLDAFINLTSEAMVTASDSLPEKIKNYNTLSNSLSSPSDHSASSSSSSSLDLLRYSLLSFIVRDLLTISSNLFTRCGFTSAQLLLPLVTSVTINAEALGHNTKGQVGDISFM